MHTFKGKTCVILHNGDYSGNLEIKTIGGNEVQVDSKDIIDFVANYVREKKIAKLEQADSEQVLIGELSK